jgi:hypothetical protein
LYGVEEKKSGVRKRFRFQKKKEREKTNEKRQRWIGSEVNKSSVLVDQLLHQKRKTRFLVP